MCPLFWTCLLYTSPGRQRTPDLYRRSGWLYPEHQQGLEDPCRGCNGTVQLCADVYKRQAKLIVREMAEILMFRLTEKKLVTESITLEVGYRENVDKGGYRGPVSYTHLDVYKRQTCFRIVATI